MVTRYVTPPGTNFLDAEKIGLSGIIQYKNYLSIVIETFTYLFIYIKSLSCGVMSAANR